MMKIESCKAWNDRDSNLGSFSFLIASLSFRLRDHNAPLYRSNSRCLNFLTINTRSDNEETTRSSTYL